jgi:hypothetical protein
VWRRAGVRQSAGVRRVAGAGRIVAVLGMVGGASASAARAQDAAIDTVRARGYFEEIRRLDEADGGRLWGRPIGGPVLFVEPRTRAVVASEADGEGRLARAGGVYIGTLPPTVGVANTAVEWAGRRWTMVLWPLPESPRARARLVAHELFHRIQPELGLSVGDPASSHLDTREGRVWLRLEWRALAAALRLEGEARRRAVEDALVFRARRRSLFAGAAEAERRLELAEGLAEYTGVALSGATAREREEWVAAELAAAEARESLARSFAYASGPAYGLLLDASGMEWRRGVSADSDLGELLARAYGVAVSGAEGAGPEASRAAAEIAATAAARGARYGGAEVEAEERARAERRAEEVARLKARFVEGAVLRLPPEGDWRFTFDPRDAVTLDGYGTVYGRARIVAAWGVLEVERGGVLFTKEGERITGFVVPVSDGAASGASVGEGWRLELAPGWAVEPGARPGDRVVRRSPGGDQAPAVPPRTGRTSPVM